MDDFTDLGWRLRGPDAGGAIWLDRGDLDDLDLGSEGEVRSRLLAFCRFVRSGEPGTDPAPLKWDLEGPDTGGVVTLLWNGEESQSFRLGHVEPVMAAFERWLAGPE